MSVVAAEQPIDVGGLWRSIRLPVALGVAALAVVALLAAVTSTASTPLDPRQHGTDRHPRAGGPAGRRGVSVDVPGTVAALTATASACGTVVLAEPGALSDSVLRSLDGSPATVLLVAPQARELTAFGVPARLDYRGSAVVGLGPPAPGRDHRRHDRVLRFPLRGRVRRDRVLSIGPGRGAGRREPSNGRAHRRAGRRLAAHQRRPRARRERRARARPARRQPAAGLGAARQPRRR